MNEPKHPAHEAIQMLDNDGQPTIPPGLSVAGDYGDQATRDAFNLNANHPERYETTIVDYPSRRLANPAQLRAMANPSAREEPLVKAHPALDAIRQLDPELGIERPIGACAKRDDGEGCDGCK